VLDELADATRREFTEWIVSLPLLSLDDLGMRKLPLITSNLPPKGTRPSR
jgi:hypothetical protein